jgi:hypothetical protein
VAGKGEKVTRKRRKAVEDRESKVEGSGNGEDRMGNHRELPYAVGGCYEVHPYFAQCAKFARCSDIGRAGIARTGLYKPLEINAFLDWHEDCMRPFTRGHIRRVAAIEKLKTIERTQYEKIVSDVGRSRRSVCERGLCFSPK